MTAAKARAYQGVSGCFSANQSVITSRFKARAQVLRRCIDFLVIDVESAIFTRADLCGYAHFGSGSHVSMATFGAKGPTQCSGFPVMRYEPNALHVEFVEAFVLLKHEEQMHHTPFGTDQQFVYCMCRKALG